MQLYESPATAAVSKYVSGLADTASDTTAALSSGESREVATADLSVTTAIVGNECVLEITGDIDMRSADDIGDLGIGTLESHAIRLLVLDMSAVTFIDSTGLGALVRMRQEAAAQGKPLLLRNPSEAVLKVLSLSALGTVLQI